MPKGGKRVGAGGKVKPTTIIEREWSEQEILDILDSCTQKLLNDDTFVYTSYHIAANGLPKSTLAYWLKKSQAVKYTHTLMRELAEAKIAQELLYRRGEINTIGALFVLKAQYKWLEEQHKQIETTEENNDNIIEIGFVDVED